MSVTYSAIARLIILCAFGYFSCITAHAQAVSGNIFGTVLDPSGAAVTGAAVTLRNTGTSVTRATTTNDSGNYSASDLAPGAYEVTITKTGFSKFVQQNVTVAVAQSTRVYAQL